MAQVTINGGGGTYLQTPMYTGLTLGANEYPKGTVTFSLASGWFFLNAGSSSTTYTYTLYVCDQSGYNAIELGTFSIKGMSSAVGISFSVSTDKPGLKGKPLYIKTVGSKEPSYIRLNSTATLTLATVSSTFTVTTSAGTGGSLRASKNSAEPGEQITLTPTPDTGYSFSSYTVTPNTVTISSNKFTMPAANVTVSASFTKTNYTVSKAVSPSGSGTVTLSKTTAKMGEEITVTTSPASGYKLSKVTTTPALTITNGKFTMPASNVTVTATFVKISYTITVSAGTGGTLTASKSSATAGEEITLTPTASSGYKFSKYTVTPNTVTISSNKFTMPAGNVTVSASFTKISYTITTSAGTGGTLTADKSTATIGDTVTLTPTASAGYYLKTLATSPARTITSNKFTMPAANVTATATFAKTVYSITVSAGTGGTLAADKETATIGETVTLTPGAKEGYHFTSYTKTPSTLTITSNKFTMPAGNVSITANYAKTAYTVSKAVSPSGSGTVTLSKSSANKGDVITVTTAPATGYKLSKITTSPALTVTDGKFTMPAANVTVTATFVKVNYTVTVSAGTGGTLKASKSTATYGEEITLTRSAASGYQFSKYTVTPSTLTITNNKFTMPASNVTVAASFSKISYTVTTSAGTGGTLTADKATATKGDTVTLTPTPSTGYKLSALTTSPACTITSNKFTMPASNVTASATFAKVSYTITAKAGTGGTLTASKSTATMGEQITLTATPATGYRLSGYTTSPTVTVTNNKFTMPAGNITVTATFAKISYTITVASATGGSMTASKSTATMGEQITLTPSPSTGYKLSTVTTSPAVTVSSNKFTMPASNITITPSFTKISYTVTVSAGTGGTLTASRSTATYGQSVTLTATASSGYRFKSYSSSPTVTISSNAFTMPASNVSITATFEKITYTVSKAVSPSDGGTVKVSRTSATKGDAVTLTQTPASGYHFTGWTSSPALTISSDKFTMPASNVTVTGNFAKTSYTITRKVNPSGAGTVTTSKTTAYKGDSITVGYTANTGYQFSGWTISPTVTISSGAFTMPAGNVTLTANFIRRSTGTLSSSSVSGGGSVTLTINSESTAYTHKYKLSFGTGMETSLTSVAAGTKTVTISIPAGWSDAIPNATSKGSGTLTLYTYKDGSQVASAYTITGLTYNVPASVVPTIGTITLTRITSYGGKTYSDLGGYYVQNHCEVRTRATASGARSSTITSYTLTISGYSTAAYKKTLSPGTASSAMDFTSGVLFLAGSTTITLTATDSRGRKVTKTSSITVKSYAPPSGTLSVYRVDASREEDPMGTYGMYTLTKQYTQLGNNSLTSTLKYSSFTASNPAASGDLMPGSRKTFSVDSEYTVQLVLQDALETVTITAKLPTARYIIYVDGTGNKIGFMKKPNKTIPTGKERTFEISSDTQVYIGDSKLEDLIWNRCFKNLYVANGTTRLHLTNTARVRIDFMTTASLDTAGQRTGSVLVTANESGTVNFYNQSLPAATSTAGITLSKETNTLIVTCTGGAVRAFCTVYQGDISLETT